MRSPQTQRQWAECKTNYSSIRYTCKLLMQLATFFPHKHEVSPLVFSFISVHVSTFTLRLITKEHQDKQGMRWFFALLDDGNPHLVATAGGLPEDELKGWHAIYNTLKIKSMSWSNMRNTRVILDFVLDPRGINQFRPWALPQSCF